MKNKKIIPAITLIIIGSLVGLFAFVTLKSGFFSSDALIEYTGKILSKGEYEETSLPIRDPDTGIKERTVQKFYFIKLEGLSGRLTTYNLNETYYKIDREINIGDEVTVKYLDMGTNNLSLQNLRKDDRVIFEDDHLRARIFGSIALIAALLIFLKAYFLLKK